MGAYDMKNLSCCKINIKLVVFSLLLSNPKKPSYIYLILINPERTFNTFRYFGFINDRRRNNLFCQLGITVQIFCLPSFFP